MPLTAGVISVVSVNSNSAALSVTPASGGTGPYTQQWYRSTTTNFTPGVGNLIAGATGLTLNDTGLIPNTVYYYKVIFTDTGNGNATVTSAQATLTTTPAALSQNQFAQSQIAGMVDQQMSFNTVEVVIDASQLTPLYPGMFVKIVDNAGGVIKVVGCAANSDVAFGAIEFDPQHQSFNAGDRASVGIAGTVMYLYSTGAISRGVQVTMNLAAAASVQAANGGDEIVGWAFDKFASNGSIGRIFLRTPTFTTA